MADDAPFCFYCGYNLTGLELPHLCPECGQMADPQRQAEEARAWFASWRAWFGAVRRPSRLPPGLLYVLGDERSRRIARRRVFVALVLPAILTLATVLTGTSFVIHKTGRSYYINPKDLARTPLSVEPLSHDERPFNFYLHMRWNLFGPGPPPSWEYVEEVTSTRARFAPPPVLDPWAATAAFSPLLVLVFGYGSAHLLLAIVTRKLRTSQAGQRIRLSLRLAMSMPAVICGLGSWLWLVGVVYWLVVELGELQHLADVSVLLLVLASLAAWIMAGILSSLTFIRLDRGGVVFVPWYWFCLASIAVSVLVPILAWYLLMLAWVLLMK